MTDTGQQTDAATHDPIVAIGHALQKLWQNHGAQETRGWEARKAGNMAEETAAEREEADIWDAIKAQAAIASTLKARSIPGALVQLSLLDSLIDIMRSTAMDENQREQDLRTMARLVASIAGVLKDHAGGVDPLAEIYRGLNR